jgi:hypothetical protein
MIPRNEKKSKSGISETKIMILDFLFGMKNNGPILVKGIGKIRKIRSRPKS